MSFIVILILIAIPVYFFLIKKKKQIVVFPDNWEKILSHEVVFYQKLTTVDKSRFSNEVMRFLANVKITGIQTNIDITDKLLVASSAVIPVFGFPGWEYTFLDEVLIYPTSFDRHFNIGSNEEIIIGMVGSGTMEGKMILARDALRRGFNNPRDKKNVGVHEFIHLVDKEDGVIDGVPTSLNDKTYSLPWLDLINQKIEEIKGNKTNINPYGATNQQEFLAVAGEYFFERPHLLQAKHPQLYELLSKAFKQDPTTVLDQKAIAKKEIGRNDACPCGSGNKFKCCCLRN
jgi:Mlc titration factor MtfA (ptsG expression regulator)